MSKQKLLSLLIIFVLTMSTIGSATVVLAQDPTDEPPPVEETVESTEEAVEEETTASEEPTEEPTAEPTEEPTAEPTEEPTAEPTEEPTAEPTEEPTAEPTEEPTAEPTEEPTAEPTEEPTAEPTEEPTAEPTEEPTAEPTEEPTAEPTEEPTAEPTEEPVELPAISSFVAAPSVVTIEAGAVATSTLSWDVTGAVTTTLNGEVVEGTEQVVEVTETTTYTLSATGDAGNVEESVVVTVDVVEPAAATAGEIGTAAVVGTWTTAYIVVQNLGTQSTNVGLQPYDSSGSTVGSPLSPATNPLPSGGASSISIDSLPEDQYSAVVSSDEPIAVAVLNQNSTYKVGDLYPGISNPAQRVILPLIYRNHFGWKSKFYVQNAHSSSQNITVYTYLVGQSTPSPVSGVTYNSVAANASVTVDFADNSDFDAFGSGNNKYGYAVVEGADGPIAVVGNNIRDDGDQDEVMETYYAGLANDTGNSDAGRDYIAPVVFKKWFVWETAINIVNLDSITGTVDVTYSAQDADGGTYSESSQVEVGPNAVATYYPPVDETVGAATLSSSDIDFVTMVNSNKTPSEGIGTSIPALNTEQASTKIAVPIMFNTSIWDSAVNVVAVGDANVTASWLALEGVPTTDTKVNTSFSLDDGDFKTLYGTGTEGLGSGEVGVLYLETSTGKIMAQGNYNNPPSSGGTIAAGLAGRNY